MRTSTPKHRKHRKQTVSLLLILTFLIAVIPTFSLSAEADIKEITIVREETDRRNTNERHYLCSDGSIMAVSYAGDIHYQDEQGNYQIIDNTLVYDKSAGGYRVKDNPNFTVAFGGNSSAPAIQMTDGKGNTLTAATSVALRTESIAAKRALASADASVKLTNGKKISVVGMDKQSPALLQVPENRSEMKYTNTFGSGISAEYAVDGYSLKENVVFEYPVNYTAIETRYAMDGLWIDVNDDGSLILYNAENEAVYTVTAPYMYDTAGSECPSVDVQATLEDDTIVVRYIPDESWRNSAERVYPVVFDPLTTSALIGNVGLNMYSVTKNGSFNGVSSNTKLLAGYNYLTSNGNRYVYRSYIELNQYPTVPSGNEIVGLQIILTEHEAFGSGILDMYTIDANASFQVDDYTLNICLGSNSYSANDATTEYRFSLPPDVTSQTTTKYVIKDSADNDTGTTPHYMTFYSSRWSNVNQCPKLVAIYIPQGIANKVTTLYNSTYDRYLSAVSETSVDMTVVATDNSEWEFTSKGIGSFQIESLQHPGKCLAADAEGNVFLTNMQHTITDSNRNQLWFVSIWDDSYSIQNEKYLDQYSVGLYCGQEDDGQYTAKIDINMESSVEQRKWDMVDLDNVSDVVVTLKNINSEWYLKSLTGLNYDAETIGLGAYDTTDVYDRFGFRLVNISSQDGWKLAPITSCNGKYRVLTNNGSGAGVKMYSYNDSSPNQKFELELQSDGTYVISLKSNVNMVLTGSSSNAIMATRSESLTNQKWILSEYQYTSPQSTITDDYSKVEEYYKSLGFRSPFRNNTTNDQGVIVTDGEFTVSSDYGLRNLGDHAGVDISSAEGTKLYSIATGKVVFRDNDPDTDPGRYVIIETDYYEYDSNGTGRKVYLIYMHMQHVSINVNTVITAENIGDLELGTSGTSGKNGDQSYDPHLHLGVFLAPAGTTEFENYSNQLWVKNHPNRTALNPLLFINPNRCSIRP